MNNELHELFLDELADIYNAEQQLTKALPKLAKTAKNSELREAFQQHLEETENHISRLDQIFEGKPTVLIARGHIVKQALAKELLTHAELMTVLHRQGFDSLDEVEHCVLEPGGTFYIQRKMPPPETRSHDEVMRALHELNGKLDLLLNQHPGA